MTGPAATGLPVSVYGVVRAGLLLLQADRRSRVEHVTPDPNDRDGDVKSYGQEQEENTNGEKNIAYKKAAFK